MSKKYKPSVSLWSIEKVRPYITNIKEAKELTSQSDKIIKIHCSDCNTKKTTRVATLVNQGMSCMCSSGISFPELFFIGYLEVKNIKYDYQVKYKNLNDRRYDFRIELNGVTHLLETHGEQHFLTEDRGHYKVETIQESDNIKRQYAKDNNINLIKLDCRKSNFDFIKKSIEGNSVLPDIEIKDIPSILELIEKNKRYPVSIIIKYYNNGFSTFQISEKLDINRVVIGNILKKNNVKMRTTSSKKVICVETGIVYESITVAKNKTGVSVSNISEVCIGKRKSAGKHPITGEKLTWKFVHPTATTKYPITFFKLKFDKVKINNSKYAINKYKNRMEMI